MAAVNRPIRGVAIDAGSGLAAAIRQARGPAARPDDLMTFKRTVIQMLGPIASTVLVDATCGPELIGAYPLGCEPMLAFEADVYRISDADRITVLPDNITIADFAALGVGQLKFFIYYAPDDDPALNARKQALVADIGAQCAAHGLRFLMEPLVYHPTERPDTAVYAALKPDLVRRATATFAAARFGADVLKVEVPVDLAHVAGFGAADMTRSQALDAFRFAAAAAQDRDLVYLSAGVPFDWFEASLVMAREAEVDFSGFMCGRAIWQDAIAVFGSRGESALVDWLGRTGQDRLTRLISLLE